MGIDSGIGVPKRREEVEPKEKVVEINFDRKIVSHENIAMLREKASGAIIPLIDDLDKLRYVCEAIVQCYKNDKFEELDRGIQILGLLL